jgi:hypothetical protein
LFGDRASLPIAAHGLTRSMRSPISMR